MSSSPTLIDHIYEAAIIPEYWADICDRLASLANSFSTSVITMDGNQTYRWIASPCIQADMERFSQAPPVSERSGCPVHEAAAVFLHARY